MFAQVILRYSVLSHLVQAPCCRRPTILFTRSSSTPAQISSGSRRCLSLPWALPTWVFVTSDFIYTYIYQQGKARNSDTENRTVYPQCLVSSSGSISSIWLIVPQRSRVSDCGKLQIKGPFILLHKRSRNDWCLRWNVIHEYGVWCVLECVCCQWAAASPHYLFLTEWGERRIGAKRQRRQTHEKGGN